MAYNLIGKGGFGIVLEGTNRLMDRTQAIKILTTTNVVDPKLKKQFIREARTLASLDHPNIAKIVNAEQLVNLQDESDLEKAGYLALEFVKGKNLYDLVAEHNQKGEFLPLSKFFSLARQAATAVNHAHEKGLLHRDIKPGNFLFEEATGQVKLTDFGLANYEKQPEFSDAISPVSPPSPEQNEQLTQEGKIVGTPIYLAPEVVFGDRYAREADVYSLGATFYKLLTGEEILRGIKTEKQLITVKKEKNIPDPRKARLDIPDDLAKLVMDMLEPEPGNRLPMAEVLNRLDRLEQVQLAEDIISRRDGWTASFLGRLKAKLNEMKRKKMKNIR